ncbi:MAG: Eukaryotic peptide chain release factor GTP-binding subunit [Marteilia pararefringens]
MQIIRQPLVLPRLVDLRNFLDTRIADDHQGLQFNTRRLRVERGPCNLPSAILRLIMILIAASTFGLFIPLSFGAYYRLNIDICVAITLTSITSLFSYHTVYFYFQVLYKDPGIIIPNNDLELADNLLNHQLRYINLYFERPPIQISIADNKSQIKFCTTCRLYRPLKASHCSKCNFCIAGFDHHCAYLNICIGQKNYSTFMKLITFALLTVLTNCVFGSLLVYYLYKATSEWVGLNIMLITLIS